MTNPYHDDRRLLELLDKWQSGDFSRADEQELQSLAASDDFRRETVEGFMSSPETDHQSHLDALRRQLQRKTGRRRGVIMPQMWMAAAAVVLLVIAVVWLVPTSDKAPPLAQESAPKPEVEQPIASAPAEQKSAEAPTSRANPAASTANPNLNGILSQTAEPGATYPTMADAYPAAGGKALDSVSQSAAESANDDLAVSDKMSAKPAAPEKEYSKVEDQMEGVDMRYGNMAPKDRAESAKAKAAAKKMPGNAASSSPVGGWGDFQDYLRRNARLPELARQNNVSGSVRVQFKVGDFGQVVDIQIIKSLGFGCDEEAARLIKAYSWQHGDNPLVTVDVPFVR